MTESAAVGWGIIGPGLIAKMFADAMARTPGSRLVAIGTREPGRPGLAEAYPGARIHRGYEALLADPQVEAVYIATPHPGHAEWAIRAAEAGKHVLCEKPIAVNAAEAEAIVTAARQAGVFLGEAFMYRLHPLAERMVDLVRSGAIGQLRMIRSSMGTRMRPENPKPRLLEPELAGGAIMDIGCYTLSVARLLAGAAAGEPFLEPDTLQGVANLGETGVDEWASAVLRFPNGVIADVVVSIRGDQEGMLRVYGTEGRFEVKAFWFAGGRQGGVAEIALHRNDGSSETIRIDDERWLYGFEIEAVAAAIRAGRRAFEPPGMTLADTLGNMRALDRWRASVGLEFPMERAAHRPTKIDGRPLRRGAKAMPKRALAGIGEVSVVALGGANFETYTQAMAILDAFYEAGGNLLDTAWVYGGGRTDKLFGEWLSARGVRDEMVVIGKGAHSPLCYPDVIARQLDQSLERLKTDRIDIYFMHRDNPLVPVGEFVDAMDAEVARGRIGCYGGSNWSRERMDAAFAYAAKTGRRPPSALSNNFSLAAMIEPPWAGCFSAADEAWRTWLAARGIPNFAWSSQARGFFTDRAGRERREDAELVRCWYSETNFGRRDRAAALGAKRGRSALHVALAYCIAQANPVLPLIGPLTLGELEDSLLATDISLTPDEVRWLENG